MSPQSSPSSDRRAVVIGGSLGGLFSAVLLQHHGWQVDIFERSPRELHSRGGGIILQPEVKAMLRRVGLQPATPLGVASHERLYLGDDGEVVERVLLPQTLTSWSTLYNILRPAIADAHYHQGETLVRLEQDLTGAVAFFPSGRTERGALLVAADGVGSTARRLVLPGHEPSYAGYVAYRGLVPEAALSAASARLFRDRFVFYHYQNSHILQYPVPGEVDGSDAGARRQNWVWYVNTDLATELLDVLTDQDGVYQGRSIPPGRMAADTANRLRERAGQELPPPFRELVQVTEAPFVQPVLDLEVPQMAFGRIALLGDAAFIPRPHTAASTAKAAANAMALVDSLEATECQVDRALLHWEPGQLQLGQRLVLRGQQLGDRSQFPERMT